MKRKNLNKWVVTIGFLVGLSWSVAMGQIIYVDINATGSTHNGTSWVNAYLYLQDAFSSASASDEIWVAEGTYRPDQGAGKTLGHRGETFRLISGVAMYGGFPSGGGGWESRDPNAHKTTLSGDLNGNDGPNFVNYDENSYHVVQGSGQWNYNTILDGFIIAGGNANSGWPHNAGGGMFNQDSAQRIENCIFRANYAIYGGGMYSFRSGPQITKCIFYGNAGTYGAGLNLHGGGTAPTLVNCTFTANYSDKYGGGIYTYWSKPSLINCILWGNRDTGGMDRSAQYHVTSGGSPTISYSCVQGGWSGTGNINEDPLFVDADGPDDTFGTEDDNLRLLITSPCIDAGDPDPNYNDPDGSRNDMGAYCNLGNRTPVAEAGADQSVHAGTVVTLDGSASSDPDEDYPLTYLWQITSKPEQSEAELSEPNVVNPSFLADLVGDYTVELIVTDSKGAQSTADSVNISTYNTSPGNRAGKRSPA
jgi:hypothetical protein